MIRIGVDLGGSKIEIIALAGAGTTLLRRRIASPAAYEAIVAAVAALVEDTERELGARGSIGVGTPGTLSRATGTMKNCNTVCLNGKPLLADLQAQLGRPLRLANVANCFALSEAIDGAAAGAGVVFGVILGTGVGGGVVVNGEVLVGPNGIAGEWGHNPLPLPGPDDAPLPACYCGRDGCIETYLSGPGWTAEHARRTGERLEARELATRAAAGDAQCAGALDRYAERLARSLAVVINVLDPDVIVLGGGLSNIEALYREVPARWGRYVFSDRVDTRLVQHAHGDSSGVRGAAFLWPAS
ncbi:MAG TPA: ROK family protein [Burkholderiaceae bacterium]|nr:ROK family protein [Burkholderiaceae bacterium]